MAHALDVTTTAGILFVVALGLLLIFGVLKIINLAHGAFLTIGGYAVVVTTQLHLSPWLAFLVAPAVGLLIGVAVEVLVVRRLYARSLDAILATWGLSIVVAQLITLQFGRGVQFTNSPVAGAVTWLGTTYSLYRLLVVAAAVALGLGILVLVRRTRLGLVSRAVIMNEDLAEALGIDTRRVRFVTFCLGAGLASLAGAMITPLSSVDPNMGVPWLINAFMLVLVSGVSLPVLGLATLVMGGAEVLVSTYVNPILGGLTIVVLAVVVLRLRPTGFARA
jgi:urea transport system permease protein